MTVKTRFAPSPTGRLHVGNVRTALFNYLFTRREGGTFLLRLDDTDPERSTEAFANAIVEDLAWLGLAADERARQSDRLARYDAAAEKLKAAGHLYPCYETPEELERKRRLQRARNQPPVYDRAALRLSDAERRKLEAEGRRPHWRFRLDLERIGWTDLVRGEVSIDLASLSDPVLIRADGSYLYTLPSVVDDMELGVTHIIRGEDHVTNTAAQIEIFQALGGTPPTFAHHPLLVAADGSALSKRLGSLAVTDLREEGIEPMAILSLLAKLGTSDAVEPAADFDGLAGTFDFAKLGRAPARFDPAELKALNARLLHETPYEAVADRLAAMGVEGGAAFWETVRPNVTKLDDARDWWRVVNGPVTPVMAAEDGKLFEAAARLLPEEIDAGTWAVWTGALKTETGRKGRALFMPLRLALTGLDHGPEMARLLPLIGAGRARRRLRGETA
jgi:glutamyl-tRNA synthetase